MSKSVRHSFLSGFRKDCAIDPNRFFRQIPSTGVAFLGSIVQCHSTRPASGVSTLRCGVYGVKPADCAQGSTSDGVLGVRVIGHRDDVVGGGRFLG